jgi:hypothetical protein
MKKIIKLTESDLKKLIGNIISEQSTMDMNEYSDKFMSNIVNKFKEEASSEVEMYVIRFKEISKNLENRDITQYSWDQLKQTVDSYVDRSQKDYEKGVEHHIDKEVERNYGRASKDAQDRYRDYMSTQMADNNRERTPDWKNRLNN